MSANDPQPPIAPLLTYAPPHYMHVKLEVLFFCPLLNAAAETPTNARVKIAGEERTLLAATRAAASRSLVFV